VHGCRSVIVKMPKMHSVKQHKPEKSQERYDEVISFFVKNNDVFQTEVLQEVLINKEEENEETIYFSRIMFLPAIEQYKLSVISYFHVEKAKITHFFQRKSIF
jgi:hypothetical protein